VIILEGTRHNFLPRDLLGISDWAGLAAPPTWVDQSELGQAAIELNILPNADFSFTSRISVNHSYQDYTLSIYAWVLCDSQQKLTLRVSDGRETQCANAELSRKPQRLIRASRFADSPAWIEIEVLGANQFNRQLTLRLSMPVLEEGLFATTPISLGAFRAEDQLSYLRAGNFFEETVGTIAFFFVPSWSAHELSAGLSPHLFSCSNHDGSEAVEIFVDSNNGGCISVRLAAQGREHFIRSDVFPQREKLYAIALTWLEPSVRLIVNGYPVGETEMTMPTGDKLGETVYLGKSSRSDCMSAFGCFENLIGWALSLTDYQLRAIAYEMSPNQFPQFRFAHLYAGYDTSSWPSLVVNYLLKYPNKFQQSPPRWARENNDLLESDFRDDFCRAIGSLPDVLTIPEEHAEAGRTDVLFACNEDTQQKRVRVEYKIWGRHDYRDVPAKPLKYFRTGDRQGAVFMINPNKQKPIGEEYRAAVLAHAGGCSGIIDLPFGDTLAEHFVSLHELPWGQAEVLHVVMDLLR